MTKMMRLCAGLLLVVALGCGGTTDDGRVAQLETELAQLQSDFDDLSDQLSDAQAAAAVDASTITALQASLASAQADLASAQADLTTAQAGSATAASTIADLEAQRAALQGQLSALQAVVTGLSGSVTLELPFVFGSQSLQRNVAYPIPGSADSASFDQVRYWLSNVELVRADGSSYAIPDSYYLMEIRGHQEIAAGIITDNALPIPDLPNDRRETLVFQGVPAGVYTGIRFHVGIDPVKNGNFADYAGELHVLQNMFDIQWMWLTSYVFTKTHGTVSGASNVPFAWDNGTDADYRTVDVDFGSDASLSVLHPHRIEIAADLSNLVTTISPRATPSIGAGSPTDRATLADGFRDMFELVAVESLTP